MVASVTMRQTLRLSMPVTDVPDENLGEAAAESSLSTRSLDAENVLNHTKYYGELTAMLERLHRRYLDVVRLGLESIGVNDINASQALILLNVGEGEVPIRDLVQRGYYLASSASYNIKKLVDYYRDPDRQAVAGDRHSTAGQARPRTARQGRHRRGGDGLGVADDRRGVGPADHRRPVPDRGDRRGASGAGRGGDRRKGPAGRTRLRRQPRDARDRIK